MTALTFYTGNQLTHVSGEVVSRRHFCQRAQTRVSENKNKKIYVSRVFCCVTTRFNFLLVGLRLVLINIYIQVYKYSYTKHVLYFFISLFFCRYMVQSKICSFFAISKIIEEMASNSADPKTLNRSKLASLTCYSRTGTRWVAFYFRYRYQSVHVSIPSPVILCVASKTLPTILRQPFFATICS